ncbi:hypothetical protein OD917_20220 [Flavobacterium sp. SH_e]|uniref:hypothetical protein n=1 Tax=Flavobacterium sp. SH_e TaxID=2983767 RepID=UPI0021E500ED|nr:hypothetical protein [Flavobacterium sp. SH_e]MCV2487271.1 hypothetical protein [Flavobacterium sp. SH_e]
MRRKVVLELYFKQEHSVCHSEERRISLETPQRIMPIFVDKLVRFFVPQNDKIG